jgi:hypothetical protein
LFNKPLNLFKILKLYLLDLFYKKIEMLLQHFTPCSFGLSATSQQYFSLKTNQPPATSQQYFSLRTNQHQPPAKGTGC